MSPRFAPVPFRLVLSVQMFLFALGIATFPNTGLVVMMTKAPAVGVR